MKDFSKQFPTDWTALELGSLGTFAKGKGILKDQLTDTGLPCVRYGELYTIHDFIVREFGSYIGEVTAKESKKIKSGDLLFAGSGETRDEIGKSAAYLREDDAYAGGDVIVLSTGSIDTAEFLAYAMETNLARKQRFQLGQGHSVVHIYRDDIAKIKVGLPPVGEQRAIARVLGTMDELISKTNRLIAQKELRKKWLMQNLLTAKKRLKGFTGDWQEMRIGELLGKVFRYVEWSDQDVYKLVSIRRRYGGLFERGDFFGHQIEVKKIKSVFRHDFLISKRQVSHGAWGVVHAQFHDWKVSDEYDCLAAKDPQKLNMEFWNWFCKQPVLSHFAYLASNGVHVEKLIFDFDAFKKRKVVIPSYEEQTAIADVLQAADKEITLLKAKTEKLREQKKGLMQQLLTGKKRLKLEQ